MKKMIIFFTFAITSISQLDAKEELVEIPVEMQKNIDEQKNTQLGDHITKIIEEEGGMIAENESTRISNEEEKAIIEAESVKVKSIAKALAVKEEAIARAKKANALAEIEANKVTRVVKAEALATAEKKKSEAKLRVSKRKAKTEAQENRQKIMTVFKAELEASNKKLRLVIGSDNFNKIHKGSSTSIASESPKVNMQTTLLKEILPTDKIEFEKGNNTLTSKGKNSVAELAKVLKNRATIKIEIAGYTDSDGSNAYNKKLSQARVDMVKKVLITNHISPTRLIARGYGEAKPLVANTTEANKQKNRRVEIYITKS